MPLLFAAAVTGEGAHVEVSLLESVLDLQFEVLTTYLNDGGKPPVRSNVNNAHAYLGAPYGIYATADGYLALAMGSIVRLGELLECPAADDLRRSRAVVRRTRRDQSPSSCSIFDSKQPHHWLCILEPADIWCSDVLTWDRLFQHPGFTALDMVQTITRPGGSEPPPVVMRTTRCPIRIDGELLTSPQPAPRIGEHTERILQEFSLDTSIE